MRDKRYFLIASMLCLFSACSTLREGRTVRATDEVPVSTPSAEELKVGEITFVRGTADPPFVLVTLNPGVSLPDGVRLQASSEDGAVAHLKTTRQRRDGYQVANIVSGRPRRGDLVVMRYPKGDGTDPEDVEEWDDIPPLLRQRDGGSGRAASSGRGSADRQQKPTVSRDWEREPGDGQIPPSALEPAATREDVEPRPPSREMVPLELPTWEPDEGDDFIQPADSSSTP